MKLAPTLEELTVDINFSLREVMMVIGNNEQGICFVKDVDILAGVITDGDIRRALLAGFEMNSKVDEIIRPNFFCLPVNSSLKDLQSALSIYKMVPIVDNNHKLVDYACEKKYHQIPLAKPVFDGNELEYVTDCLKSGWISSQGKYVAKFETEFGEYVENENTLAVSNGTVALHLALAALGIGPNDEVILPNLTFAAPANAVIYQGATPVFCDVDRQTLMLDVSAAEKLITNKTRAIIPVHLYGFAADMDKLINLASKYNLYLIEDCAEAFGTRFKNKHVGNFSDIATFSFFGNKTITTGEGGMMMFRDQAVLKTARILRDHGMNPSKRYWHDVVGYNYRLTNIQAAVGLAQLERATLFVNMKRTIANLYIEHLQNIDEIRLPFEDDDIYNSYWLFTIVLDRKYSIRRNFILEQLAVNGIEARPIFYPLHEMPPYFKYIKKDASYEVSKEISECGISLPSSYSLGESEVLFICNTLKKILAECK
jgi:perosamine synthetase